jgi:hypothetical protein
MATVALIAEKTIGEGKVRRVLRIQGGIAAIICIHVVTIDIKDIYIHDITTGIADICIPGFTIDIRDICTPCITMGITDTETVGKLFCYQSVQRAKTE